MNIDPHLPFTHPVIAEEYIENGVVLYEAGHYQAAIDAFTSALHLDPDNADTLWHRGWTYFHYGRRAESKADFLLAIELDPSLEDDVALAPKWTRYDEQIKQNPQDYRAWCKRGERYAVETFYEEAIEQFNQALAINPVYAPAYYERAMVHDALLNYQQAINDLTEVVAYEPSNVHAYYYRAWFYKKTNDNERMANDLATCLSLVSDTKLKRFLRKTLKNNIFFAFPTEYQPA